MEFAHPLVACFDAGIEPRNDREVNKQDGRKKVELERTSRCISLQSDLDNFT